MKESDEHEQNTDYLRVVDDTDSLTKAEIQWIKMAYRELPPDRIRTVRRFTDGQMALAMIFAAGGTLVGLLGLDKVASAVVRLFEIVGGDHR